MLNLNWKTWDSEAQEKFRDGSLDDPDSDYRSSRLNLPPGMFVRYLIGGNVLTELLGNNLGGYRTSGCDCCSVEWENRDLVEYAEDFVQFAKEVTK